MILPVVTVKRNPNTGIEGGTFGLLTAPGGFSVYTLERPRLGDHPCIPAGGYKVQKGQFPMHGLCYEVKDVPGRSAILIHAANWYRQLLGCIALGRAIMLVEGMYHGEPVKELGISSSKDAVEAFWEHMGGLDFHLDIC